MMRVDSWQKAEIPGPIKAFPISDSKKLALLIKRAKKTLIVVGYRSLKLAQDKIDMTSYVIDLASKLNAHIAVTNTLIKEFSKKGYENTYLIPAMELADRLRDPEWKGFDGKGNYDMVVFIGFPYYYEWLILNGLKHFAYKHLKTVSLDPYYQPNATFSLPNLSLEKWIEFLKSLKDNL
ncbi:MAG: CO dehydrogenase/acetyl-CoA synthase complex subunit epsilon [Thermofilum sp. ex4484_82]|nr:MAG: CO dehydrogenase/acetyl-CoA synthase complex subunit epsilon [Thermofilum sp. ex4484_82]OYT39734.1 MAG: CO dehydrogenase/acetyl-CoA synthase complex subunit epsilon [Archaeoglobales archaeon ex4484_92]RLE76587.1 MAG: CO dehydrogenase/acetyl-CoA synthase complex subunit epsilon [Thermoprotei archaeon]RLE77685.1 MAG: CO dehydrogenase/acetyl-CoA synthase complex subunit epsilon [Thermoprotei archaeon]RLE84654.1 MAG: CO dehydrogenase/acetyl-CoA synthase complex subunit epsilon [Thermoprotei